MASTIRETAVLSESLVNKDLLDTPLDSKKIVEWACTGGCGWLWRESVVKRAKFELCPKCESSKQRSSVPRPPNQPPPKRVVTPLAKKVKGECPICCVDGQMMLKCPWCEYEVCVECMKTYILGGVGPARCMTPSCDKVLPNKLLISFFTKKWVTTEYKNYISKTLVEHEKSRIPESLPVVAMLKEKRQIKERLEYLNNHGYLRRSAEAREIKALRRRYTELTYEITTILEGTPEGAENKVKVSTYLQGCPDGACRGLINEKGNCEVCDVVICKDCRVRVDSEHKCDPSTVLTIKSLHSNTKPCPKCAASIYKIDGCDQMFCVVCHTAFSWKTGRVETGNIHNPHFFEWLRNQSEDGVIPRDAGRVRQNVDPCITREELLGRVRRILMRHLTDDNMRVYSQMTNYLYHTSEANIRRFSDTNLNKLRVKYLTGELSEELWTQKITAVHRRLRYELSGSNIYTNMSDIIRGLLIDFLADAEPIAHDGHEVVTLYVDLWEKCSKIREQINQAIVDENSDMDYGSIEVLGKWWDRVSYRNHRKGIEYRGTLYDGDPKPIVIPPKKPIQQLLHERNPLRRSLNGYDTDTLEEISDDSSDEDVVEVPKPQKGAITGLSREMVEGYLKSDSDVEEITQGMRNLRADEDDEDDEVRIVEHKGRWWE